MHGRALATTVAVLEASTAAEQDLTVAAQPEDPVEVTSTVRARAWPVRVVDRSTAVRPRQGRAAQWAELTVVQWAGELQEVPQLDTERARRAVVVVAVVLAAVAAMLVVVVMPPAAVDTAVAVVADTTASKVNRL